MTLNEKTFTFGKDNSLIGIVTNPQDCEILSNSVGVILLNAGLLHRVGPNRIYVKLARKLAKNGHLCFRFDFSGIGDSFSNNTIHDPWQRKIQETQEAMNFLTLHSDIKHFILCGLCSGGEATLRTSICDSRVAGSIIINAIYVETKQQENIKKELKKQIDSRYYSRNILNPESWRRLLTGKSNTANIIKFIKWKTKNISFKTLNKTREIIVPDIWNELISQNIPSLLIYSDGSPTWDYFHNTLSDWIQLEEREKYIQVSKFPNTDHIFTLLDSQRNLINTIESWININKERFLQNKGI